jgi:hypothetical protein
MVFNGLLLLPSFGGALRNGGHGTVSQQSHVIAVCRETVSALELLSERVVGVVLMARI